MPPLEQDEVEGYDELLQMYQASGLLPENPTNDELGFVGLAVENDEPEDILI